MGKRIHLELAAPDGEAERHLFELSRNNLYIGRHPDNDLVLDHEAVSPFHIVLDVHRNPYRIMVLSDEGETRCAGRRLATGKSHPVPANAEFEVAGYRISVVAQEDQSAITGVQRAVPASPSLPVHLDLDPADATVEVDEPRTFRLTIRNAGAATSQFSLRVKGPHRNWVAVPSQTVTVPAGSKTSVPLHITVPRLPHNQAGQHRLTVELSSPDVPGWYCHEDIRLTVEQFYHVSLGEITPGQQRLSPFDRFAIVNTHLTNHGNGPARYLLAASDAGEGCQLKFYLPGEQEAVQERVEVTLEPGSHVPIPVRVVPPRRPLVGKAGRTHQFGITAVSLSGPSSQRTVEGRIDCPPLVGPAAIIGALLVLILATGYTLSSQQIAMAEIFPFASIQARNDPSQQALRAARRAAQLEEGRVARARAADPLTYKAMFQEIGARFGVNWRLLAAVAYQESRLDPGAIGRSNDMGLMQIMPATWNQFARTVGVSDPFDPYSNAVVGAAFLAFLQEYCQGLGYTEERWVLAAYNWGPANVRRLRERGGDWSDVPAVTRKYALRIVRDAHSLPPPQWMEEKALELIE